MDFSSISDQVGEALEKGVSGVTQNTKKAANDAANSVVPNVVSGNSQPTVENLTQNLSNSQSNSTNTPSIENLSKLQDDPAAKAVDQSKIEVVRKKLRKELHDEVYYNPTFVNRKPDENRQRIEETQVEEKQKELVLEEQKKTEVPLAVRDAQQKTERLPDAG